MNKTFKFLILTSIIFINSGVHAEMTTKITIKTNLGNISLELNDKKAPITVENFKKYIKTKHYENTIFHRVIKNFMIQGGGFTSNMDEKNTLQPITNEADNKLSNKRGTIAMARTSNPHSATAQFYINLKDNEFLDHTKKTNEGWGYCVFGKVVKGIEVIDEIAKVKTKNYGPYQDVPEIQIIINEIIIE